MNKIIRRVLIVVPAVILQAMWLFLVFGILKPWAGLITFALSILSFLLVLYIITKTDEGTYKILWLLVILSFPLPGALLYLIFGNKRTTLPLRKKLAKAKSLPPLRCSGEEALKEIAEDDLRISQTFRTLQKVTGLPAHRNSSATYYQLGDDAFPVMLEEMEKAEKFIFVEYFIVDKGYMWDSMVEVMARKAAQGVDVRVLYDDMGSISTYSRSNVLELEAKKIRCVPFNPMLFIKGTLNYRDHRKMLIIDGKVAFSGGINLADEYINKVVKYGHWKDISFRVTGPAVENFTRMFAEFWNAFCIDKIPEKLWEELPDEEEPDAADGWILSYYDSPIRDYAASNELYIDLLSQAEKTAYFFTPYLMPGEALLGAFVRAAQRGVDVRIIMPGIPDKAVVYRMSRSFYPVLLKAGIRIFEYEPGFVHAKGCVVDDKIGTVGTVNLDYRSLFLHFENNSLFYKASILKDLKADILATQEKCRERTVDNMPKGVLHFIVDGVLRIFAPLC